MAAPTRHDPSPQERGPAGRRDPGRDAALALLAVALLLVGKAGSVIWVGTGKVWNVGLRVTAWWTALLAEAVLRGSAWLLASTDAAQRRTARRLRAVAARALPSAGAFMSITAVILIWAMVVVAAFVPAATRYLGSVHWELRVPEQAQLTSLGERSVVYAADGSTLAILHDEIDRRIIPLDEVPDYVWQAVVTAEDRRFFEHEGYDLEAIGRAAMANLRARDIEQGGSTITQQLAKHNFVGAEQTLERKAEEVTYAVALEERLSKEEILERYLNEVYFGGGAYGIHAAAESYFGVAPRELTVEQAALLAAVIRAPGPLDPRRNAEAAQVRRDAVLAGMADEGYLTPAMAERARAVAVEVLPRTEREVTEPYVVEAVKREFFSNPAFGDTREERIAQLFSGGLRIHTTVDPRLQEIAEAVIAARLDGSGPTAAISSVEPHTGRVVAMASGSDFEVEQFDLATQGRRQPGSAFKTFAMLTALERGIPINAMYDGSSPVELDFDEHQPPWRVQNYGGASMGIMTLREAHVRSVNTVFAQLVVSLQPHRVAEMAERFGIDVDAALGDQSARGPAAMALGGLDRGVTPLEMASAFGAIGNRGVRARPYLVERVTDPVGNPVYEHEYSGYRVIDTPVAATAIDVMQDTVRRGTATRAQLPGWQVAGKTGTTQTSADGWFVGTVPVLATAVWMGHPDDRTPVPGLTGGSIPAEMWREFMGRALDDVDPVGFDMSPGTVAEAEVTVPNVTGARIADALRLLSSRGLIADLGGDPSATGGATVRQQDPSPGTTLTTGDRVHLSVSGSDDDDDDDDDDDEDED